MFDILVSHVSPQLIWSLIKDNNSFLVKSNGVTFSKEPNNVANLNSYKFSALAQPKSISVQPGAGNKGVVVTVQKKNALNTPSKRLSKTYIKNAGTRRIAKTVLGLTKVGYRADLEKYALARVSAIVESQKPKKPVKTGRVSLKA